jgi:hypothetical protein
MSINPGNEDTDDYCRPVDISDDDIYDAMKEIPGYNPWGFQRGLSFCLSTCC